MYTAESVSAILKEKLKTSCDVQLVHLKPNSGR